MGLEDKTARMMSEDANYNDFYGEYYNSETGAYQSRYRGIYYDPSTGYYENYITDIELYHDMSRRIFLATVVFCIVMTIYLTRCCECVLQKKRERSDMAQVRHYREQKEKVDGQLLE